MAITQPQIQTPRLILRRPALSDAKVIQQLAGAREIAQWTLTMPHPYPDGAAEAWIARHEDDLQQDRAVHFAIAPLDERALVGMLSLSLSLQHDRAEMGYWIGVPYWGRGYCTEAAAAVLGYGFETLGLHRVYANHFAGNTASGRVMQKIGLKYEGTLRQHVKKWGQYLDMVSYGLTRE